MLRSIIKQSGESTMGTGDTYTKTTEPAGCRLGASICRLAQTIIRWGGGAHWRLQAANTLCAAAAVSPDATITVSTCTCNSSRQEAEEDRIHSITQYDASVQLMLMRRIQCKLQQEDTRGNNFLSTRVVFPTVRLC